MSAFTGDLTVTCLDEDAILWRLEQPLRYEIGELGSGRVITAPAGFETDVASIPWPLRAVLPAWGRYSRAAIVHDWLYECLRGNSPDACALSRKEADAVFHEAMLVQKVPSPLAWVMWASVRVFGARRASAI